MPTPRHQSYVGAALVLLLAAATVVAALAGTARLPSRRATPGSTETGPGAGRRSCLSLSSIDPGFCPVRLGSFITPDPGFSPPLGIPVREIDPGFSVRFPTCGGAPGGTPFAIRERPTGS